MIEEGQPFPAFALPDQDEKVVTLSDLSGERAVIYFYPKDDTTGCTTEACGFRDEIPSMPGIRVIGVSPDGPRSHRRFIEKNRLNFTLLADENHTLAEALGIWVEKSMYGNTYMGIERTTYVLNADGVIVKIFRKVKPQGHAKAVLEVLGI